DAQFRKWGYDIPDWPVSYRQMEPYFNVAESLLAVSGNRKAVTAAIKASAWYQAIDRQSPPYWDAAEWSPAFEYPCPAMPRTPVGEYVARGLAGIGWHSAPLPSGMVSNALLARKDPAARGFDTGDAIRDALKEMKDPSEFWKKKDLWSER